MVEGQMRKPRRRKQLFVLLIALVSIWPASRLYGQANQRRRESPPVRSGVLSPREIAAKVSQSLVLIVAQDKEGEPIGRASGFFYTLRRPEDSVEARDMATDLVATNLHVFKGASQGYIKVLNEGITYKISQVVGIDMQHDLCTFKAAGASGRPLVLANSKVGVGDDAYVGGNPRGLEASFSKGIISAIRREKGLIQIDAPISPGSSGGPVVNTRAEVIGVATASLVDGQNLNFAVSVGYLANLRHTWEAPVSLAGALALKDTEIDKLKGSVRTATTRIARYKYSEYEQRYKEGPSLLEQVDGYDSYGNKTEQCYYSDGVPQLKHRYEYDERNLKTRISLSMGGKYIYRTLTELEAINDRTDRVQSSSVLDFPALDGTPRITGTYDRAGNQVEMVMYNETGPEKTVWTFDRNGWEVEETVYVNGKLRNATRYTYEVDELGNWVKRYDTHYSASYPETGFTPSYVHYREITYYGDR